MTNSKPMMMESQVVALLQNAGIKPTRQRVAIYSFICNKADHPTAEIIQNWMIQKEPKGSLATVYNTLKVLVENGLLLTMRLPQTDKVIYDANVEPHHHFFDEKTGKLHDIPLEDVQLSPALNNAFKINKMDLLLTGTIEN